MNLIQLASLLIPIAILDSINPSAIILTILMLTKGTQIKNILAYISGIFVSYFAIGATALIVYRYFGSGFKPDFSFVAEYINKPPFWVVLLEFVAGVAILINSIYSRVYPKNTKEKPPKRIITQTSLLSFVVLGVGITGLEATTALPYFGTISTMFLANFGLLTNLVLVFFYCLIFVIPPLALIGIRLVYKEQFESVLAKLKKLSAKYMPNIWLYGNLILAVYLIIDSLQLLVNR
jgi:Sap, sulfolipid-1-addressing protein